MDNGIFEANFDLEQHNALPVFIRVNLWLIKEVAGKKNAAG